MYIFHLLLKKIIRVIKVEVNRFLKKVSLYNNWNYSLQIQNMIYIKKIYVAKNFKDLYYGF